MMACGYKAVQLMQNMEENDRVLPLTFKAMEAVIDPADYEQIIADMDPELGHPLAAKLKAVTMSVLRRRWWHWLILHPAIKEDRLHPSRSVFCMIMANANTVS